MPSFRPLLFVTGFGPFEEVRENESGLLAGDLIARPPAFCDVAGGVLPVSFERAPRRLEAMLSELDRPVDLLLAMGVHREPGFRIELEARTLLTETARPDVDGRTAAGAERCKSRAPGERRVLRVAEPLLLETFARARDGWGVSRDAGGYVCERVFRAALEWGERAGTRSFFVHVPRARFTSPARQREELEAFLRAVL